MGSWGVGVEQDDVFLDVYGGIERAMREGASLAEACAGAVETNRGRIADDLEGPVFWMAVAKAQWTYGRVEEAVLERVRADVRSGRGLELWEEAGEATLRARKAALARFLDRVSSPREKPKRPPRKAGRQPPFAAGDCLAIRHGEAPDVLYGAALVTVADDAEPEAVRNLVCTLSHLSPEPPTLAVFEARDWLRRGPREHPDREGGIDAWWYYHIGFRSAKARLQVVGRTQIRDSDPKDTNLFGNWKLVGAEALRRALGEEGRG